MNWINLFTGFEGRISRQPFWIGILALAAIEVVVALLTHGNETSTSSSIADLILTYPEFAVVAKRAHDRNISTWVVGIFFAGSVAFDLLMLTGRAVRASDATTPFMVAVLVWGVFGLVLLADLGFRHGTDGPNRYGPDPLTQDRQF